MARPIKDTPILKGHDAERFMERMLTSDERKVSNERRAEMQSIYNTVKASFMN